MSRTLRWLLIVVVGVAALAIGGSYLVSQRVEPRLARVYQVEVAPIPVPTDQAAIDRGQHLVATIFFCQECHGEQLEGSLYFDHPLTGRIAAANLTAGRGGIGDTFRVEDWDRAIRHGLGTDGRPLFQMPSHVYNRIADEDLAAIIAYLRSLPPLDNELPERTIGPLNRLALLSDPSLLAAEVIDHDASRPSSPEPGVTVEYGRYLSASCTVCHGEDFAGGSGAGAGLNLTGGGDLANWTEDDFLTTLRTGVTPLGDRLNPELMPWERISQMTDDELRAIWLYLLTLTAVQTDGG